MCVRCDTGTIARCTDPNRHGDDSPVRQLRIAGLTANEHAALHQLYSRVGAALVGDAPEDIHPSWAVHLDALAERGLVDAYPENGTLADDPGRTFYELAPAGYDKLARVRDIKAELATW